MEQDQEYTCTEPLGILPEIFSTIGMLSAIIRIFRKTGTNCSRFRLHISVLFDRLKFHVRFSLAAIQDFDSRRSTSLSVRTNLLRARVFILVYRMHQKMDDFDVTKIVIEMVIFYLRRRLVVPVPVRWYIV